MREIYIAFSLVYFIAGAIHLYQQYKTNQLLQRMLALKKYTGK